MKTRRILVVGGLAAGPSAAAKAKRTNPHSEVIMFEATETISYGICESPYVIGGVIEHEARLVAYTPDRLREEKGVMVKPLHRAEKINPSNRTLVARDLQRREHVEYDYDKLILATGAHPKRLNVQGEDGRNVFHMSSREDTLNIMRWISENSPKTAVIIGGGYIGMEMSEALCSKGLEVTIIHRHRLPMAGLETETREQILRELQKNEVHFVTNAKVESLQQSKDSKVEHVITNRGSFPADIVILSLGVLPNAEITKRTGIRLGASGGIITDERQQTNVDNIYAAGDCCEVKNIVSGKQMYLPLATIASRSAWVAGENAAGGKARFKGAIRAIAVKIFGIEVAHVGLSADEAKDAGFDVVSETIIAPSKVSLMPSSGKITVTMIIDRTSKRLVGANVFGGDGAVLRADVLGVAIQHQLTIDDISRFDMIYSPPFAPLWDPVLVAANQARKKL